MTMHDTALEVTVKYSNGAYTCRFALHRVSTTYGAQAAAEALGRKALNVECVAERLPRDLPAHESVWLVSPRNPVAA